MPVQYMVAPRTAWRMKSNVSQRLSVIHLRGSIQRSIPRRSFIIFSFCIRIFFNLSVFYEKRGFVKYFGSSPGSLLLSHVLLETALTECILNAINISHLIGIRAGPIAYRIMEMVNLHLLQPFIIALFLGALLGFERTFASRLDHEVEDFLGGIRTYSLVSLFGALATFLSDRYFPEVLALAFAGIIAMTTVSYYIGFNKHNEGGITTEVSLLICFLIGVTVQKQHVIIALFITLGTAALLHMKDYLHRFTDKVEAKDIRAALKFAIITF